MNKSIKIILISCICSVAFVSCITNRFCKDPICRTGPVFYYFFYSKEKSDTTFTAKLSFINDSVMDSLIFNKYKKYWYLEEDIPMTGLACRNYYPRKGKEFPFLLIFENRSDRHVFVYQNITCNNGICWGKYKAFAFQIIRPEKNIITATLYKCFDIRGDSLIDVQKIQPCYLKMAPKESIMILAYIEEVKDNVYQKKDNKYIPFQDSIYGEWCYRIEVDYTYYNKDEKLEDILMKPKQTTYTEPVCFDILKLNNDSSINPLSDFEKQQFFKWMQ